MNLEDITTAWDKANPACIHPTREHHGEDAYWATGEAQADMIATVLKPGSRVVDFGCGDGRVTIPLTARGYHVTGADASENMLARLHERAPQIPVVHSIGLDLYAKLGRKTDAVVSLAVLIHHSYTDAADIIAGLAKAVRKGGLLVLDWPTSDQPTERTDWIGVTTWSPEQQAALAETIGLTRVDATLPFSVWRA